MITLFYESNDEKPIGKSGRGKQVDTQPLVKRAIHA